ncbi:DUF6146 family protein [Nonlabens ulvanivorans]|uniref:DUF6146 family protein n=1 Tax=Nonlabens ulvanivorans TaxID=906888 RepID=UPI000502A679|nr:DUF6146 family protein [Nonlabens ulvanivorans]WOI23575.1 DUF6146 family protein [Nonlabens ulvanivorans]GAK91641.1 hypothetical protein JCM19297_1592 [Nonlabens ulvanivorans]
MKTTFLFIALLTIIISCNSYQPAVNNNNATGSVTDTLRIANDSLEYEIIIIEPGFNSWLVTQPPRGFYSQSTLELRNNFSVREYNLRVNNPINYNPDLYVWRIDYDRNVDYGYEVNYLLYNYFLFFEKRYGQKLR